MAINHAEGGFSLVETLLTLAVLAILAALATPAWSDWVRRQRVDGISRELATDLQYIRSEAVLRNVNLRFSFQQTGGGSCYLIHSGAAGACTCSSTGIPTCTAPAEAIKTVFRPVAEGITIQSSSASMIYSARRGTVSPTGTIEVADCCGLTIRHTVNLRGRIKVCSVGSAALGHSACVTT